MKHPNAVRFESVLTEQFVELFSHNPAYQRVKATHTPQQLAEKITLSLTDGTGDKDGEGVQRTCAVLGLKHTYKAIRAFLTNVSEIPEPKTVCVSDKDGKNHTVECFGTFDYPIDGQTFRFHITREINGLSKVVTHAKSGMKACNVAVGVAYLPAFAKLHNDKARARLALDALVERVGAARVRSVIAAQE